MIVVRRRAVISYLLAILHVLDRAFRLRRLRAAVVIAVIPSFEDGPLGDPADDYQILLSQHIIRAHDESRSRLLAPSFVAAGK